MDVLPEPPQAVPQPRLPTVHLIVTDPLKTTANAFGLFHEYLFHPLHDPDTFKNLDDLSNVVAPAPPPSQQERVRDPPWPFANMSIWRLMRWANSGSWSKSEGEVNRLVSDVLTASDFHAEDLQNFNVRCENHHLNTANKASPMGTILRVPLSLSKSPPVNQVTRRRRFLIGFYMPSRPPFIPMRRLHSPAINSNVTLT